MELLRKHWFDLGLGLAVVVAGFILVAHPRGLSLLLWLSLISLFLHQFEEYRFPGYFPGMMNTVMFASTRPDRYPLNPQTALIVNVVTGWLFYVLAAVLADRAVWLGIATMLVSVGNIFAHTILFNLRGRTRYNPGMLTADLLFLPLAGWFFQLVIARQLASATDWLLGIALGVVLNVVGILKLIDWLKDENTPHVFPARCLPPA
ncbi:MAG: HXXEE domain-containing protein [Proteobacteria bacterium]|nr:HXXEE domain-containing protein [Pseudomonadota bacterium]